MISEGIFYNASDEDKCFETKEQVKGQNYARSRLKSSLHTSNRIFMTVALYMKDEKLLKIAKDRSYELVHLGTGY